MNMGQMRFQFLEENGDEVQIIADHDAIIDGEYYILARDGDKPIFAYGSEDCGYQYDMLSEVGAMYQYWFRTALRAEGLKSEFDSELLRDKLLPLVP